MEGLYLALANLSSGVLFLLFAFIFRYNKNAANLIAGYNTLSKDEQAKWNDKEMCKYFTKQFFFLAIFMLASGIIVLLIGSLNTAVWLLLSASWSVFIVTLIFTIIYLNRSKRFRT